MSLPIRNVVDEIGAFIDAMPEAREPFKPFVFTSEIDGSKWLILPILAENGTWTGVAVDRGWEARG